MVKVVFVCLGNICRSPTAEAVMAKYIQDAELSDQVYVESAGTSSHHQGEPAHPMSQQVAVKKGYKFESFSQPFTSDFFNNFDWIITMDRSNYNNVIGQAPTAADKEKVTPFSHLCTENSITEVPDPYYQGDDGFDIVLDIIEDGCRGLLERIKDQL